MASRATGSKPLEAIWTRLVIDPIADRIVARLVDVPRVTPNRITLAAGILALGAALAFLTGHALLGGVLFQLRFLVDCLDGRLARARGTATTWGAALDLIVDTLGIVLCYWALASRLALDHVASPLLPGTLAALYGAYAWTLAHRKSLPGGGQHDWLQAGAVERPVGLRRRYVAAMARRGMVPTPYALEVETLALTLVPVFAVLFISGTEWQTPVAVTLWCVCGFYLAASILNVARTFRLATRIDNARDTTTDSSRREEHGNGGAPPR